MAEGGALLARLTQVLSRTQHRAPLPERLCIAFTDIVAAEGGAITLGFTAPERVVLCVTGDEAARIEDAQEVLREGPSLDAYRTGLPVGGLDHAEQVRRWPMLDEMLGDEGPALALHAFPMKPESEVVGVITVYQTEPRTPMAVEFPDAQFLANAIAVALLTGLDPTILTDASWAARDRIDQATGMVIAQLGISPIDALAILRAHAFAHMTTLDEVSAQVLSRQLEFTDLDSNDGTP